MNLPAKQISQQYWQRIRDRERYREQVEIRRNRLSVEPDAKKNRP